MNKPIPSASKPVSGRSIAKIALDALQTNPDNAIFTAPTEVEIANLADDIRRNGLIEPLEVTIKNVVISGHSRLQALRILATHEPERFGTVRVVVRGDLTTDAQIKARLLEANFTRRHLSLLQRLRVAQQMVLLSRSQATTHTGEVRDEIGKLVDLSGRQVGRLLRVLNLPPIIVEAVEKKKLTQGDAEVLAEKGDPNEIQRIAGLPAEQIPRVVRLAVRRINANLPPKKQKGELKPSAMVDRFLNQTMQLQERMEPFEKRFKEWPQFFISREKRIRIAAEVLDRLLKSLEQAKESQSGPMKKFLPPTPVPKNKLLKRRNDQP